MQTSTVRGRFITLEGIEGAGKSSILQFIESHLKHLGVACVVTREPGGTLIAEAIRQVLLNQHQEEMSIDTELLLMFASRAQHIAEVIRPALERGEWVVCDRFTDASFAYQGGGRGMSTEKIEALSSWVQGELEPDMTILLDLPVEVGFSRIGERGAKDRIESAGLEFFERVRDSYLTRAKEFSKRFRVINAEQDFEAVKAEVLTVLNSLMSEASHV